MKKGFLGLVVFWGAGMISLAWAQFPTVSNSKQTLYPKDKSQRQLGPNMHKHVRQPLRPKGSRRLNSLNAPKSGKNPLPKNATLDTASVSGKGQLLDKNGKPVTLWPAGQKKNYPTLYQDQK